ncbi:hypothetical protein EMIHUDRAFT_241817 [Emiliania huxleyi CCMP1516]|uniref:Uncharacterized protein n=2 Tax=Emiliania huxleyi TaxID=2903 RepID=A0A0D3JBB9_EMIH1|nr:hypothetical protein EMIHUDRAFT_241817 [Emiliania huxleyi CCMP1516]EOD20804.1 hypothetical protein EMIHUDRAFT_241817 [Emiliania huxleyi CCMP1516]|eukprot:XP_005773233.1 hypothetical protein EMIHUDRAFT_241817 [Emiliania huxleyi CCMP1516]
MLALPQTAVASAAVVFQRFVASSAMGRFEVRQAAAHLDTSSEEYRRLSRSLAECERAVRAEVGAAGGLLPQSGEAGRAWRARGQVLEAGDLYAILFQYLWLAFKAPVAPALGVAVGRRAYSFVNDSLRTATCVDFGPEALCCAAIWRA